MTSKRNDVPAKIELSNDELNAVVGGHAKFHYVEMNGSTYAVGHVHGQTMMVKVA